ncbi:MAG TPA: hypothetical protein VJ521_15165, partial [Acidobacteriota bacterium]|nr:hypothetical protein [Acidobacteriota bacterium]
LGLIKLGHNVLIVEEVGEGWCFDKSGARTTYERSWSRELFSQMMTQFGVMDQALQIFNAGEATTGPALEAVTAFARDTDILINNSGHIKLDSIMDAVKRRVYVDLDPVYTQLWYAEYGKLQSLDRHDVFFTVGANIGTERSEIPDCGRTWHHVNRIIDLDHWPSRYDPSCRDFTTIANWAGYGELQYGGKAFKPKYSEFMRFAELPRHVRQTFEISLKNYDPEDPRIRKLAANGWSLRNATEQIDSLEKYRRYIATSRAEIGIAQSAYVQGHSGWFSDRSAHYLASGKPVLAQATGFEDHLRTGEGLIAFKTLEEAVHGIEEINGNYQRHCRAARDIAADCFDYRKVLPEMLRIIM